MADFFKTRMTESSLDAFYKILPELSKRREQVLRPFLNGNYTAHEIVKITGIALQTVTARINELRYDFGILVGSYEIRDGRTVYRLRNPKCEPIDERPLSVEDRLKKFINKWEHIHPKNGKMMLEELKQVSDKDYIKKDFFIN